jgi:hypothetical protein
MAAEEADALPRDDVDGEVISSGEVGLDHRHSELVEVERVGGLWWSVDFVFSRTQSKRVDSKN